MSQLKKISVSTAFLVVLLAGGCHKTPDITAGYEKNFHCLMTAVEPRDLELYKTLLPDHPDFTMPDQPLVGFYVFYVYIPSLSFVEGGITIRVKYKGQEGWTLIFNTVEKTEGLIYTSARASGFPKFKVDDISFRPTDNGWQADITKDGRSWLALNFTPGGLPGGLASWQDDFLAGRQYTLSDPLYLLVPPRKGPYAYQYDTAVLAGTGGRKYEAGMVTVTTQLNEPWAGLLPSGPAPGIFFVDGK